MSKEHRGNKGIDFPLMLGGPLYQLYLRTFLVKPPLHLYQRRIIAITLFCWLPLLLLSLFGGTAFRGVKVPFLFDLDTHARLLISLGLFIGAEVIAHARMQVIVNQFIERNIITAPIRTKFNNIIASALKLRNSTVAELLLLILIYTVGHFSWMQYASLDVSTWYATAINGQTDLTMAGYWYVYISIPIFQFILCRWYYRVFIWYRFLWQVSRLPLHLNSLHPDRAAGLSFLNLSLSAFAAGLLAHSVLLTGLLANRIWHAGEALPEFKLEIVGILLFLLLLLLLPLVFFIIHLANTKRKGLVSYGVVASDYVNDFRAKWIEKEPNKNEVLLGNADIQSLADLSNSYNVINEMRIVPFSYNTIIKVALLIALPLFPLLLTMIPFSGMIDKIIRIIL